MSARHNSTQHSDAGGLEIDGGILPSEQEDGEMLKSKRGFAIAPITDARLDAMSFALGQTRSELVDEAVAEKLATLAPDKRRAVDRALRLAGERSGG